MRIALITCSIGGIDEVIIPVPQNTRYEYYCYNENNLPFPLPNLSDRLKAKYIKTQTHHFLPDFDIYIYIDGRVQVISETFIEEFVEKLQKSDVVVVDHKERKSVFEELKYILEHIKLGSFYICSRYENQQMEKELEFYEANKEDLKDVTLYGGGFFARWNNPKVNECFDEWWRRTIEFSHFDQAMFAYVLGKYKLRIFVMDRDYTLQNLLYLGKHKAETVTILFQDAYERIKDFLKENNQSTEVKFEDIKKILSTSYKNLVVEKQPEIKLMDNLLSTGDFHSIVLSKLHFQEPFAFARYSDGEIMLLNRHEYYTDYIAIIKKLWGYEPSEIELDELANYLIQTLSKVDILGFPTARHLARTDYFSKAMSVFENYVGDLDSRLLASVDVSYEFLYEQLYEPLLTDREVVNIITCRDIKEQLKQKYNIGIVNQFLIAPEPKFTSGYVGERHYPNQFHKIEEWIKTIDCKGRLCLVGGGAPSKIYNIWFKDQGGISLDIGAVFDCWFGKKTRGVGRGLDIDDNKYKLYI